MSLNKRIAGLALLTLVSPAAVRAAGAPSAGETRRVQYVMGTLFDIQAYGPQAQADTAISAAFAETVRLDRALSLYKADSEVVRFNRSNGAWFGCSPALWEALAESLKYARLSGGAYDITILPVLREGPAALPRIGYTNLELDAANRRARFTKPGMGVDFGGIGKGIALDHAARILRAHGIASALLNFGGQIYALGAPPAAEAWLVTVESSSETFALRDASISSSGNSQQPGHIASPFTGRRIYESYSAVVIAPTATEADGWDTGLFVLGPEARIPYDGCWLIPGRRRAPASACDPLLKHPKNPAPDPGAR